MAERPWDREMEAIRYNGLVTTAAWGDDVFLGVQELERRDIGFDGAFASGEVPFGDRDWRQTGDIRAKGTAELLDRAGSRTIRVRGHIQGAAESSCARCLEPVVFQFDSDFDLFYYPMNVIAKNEEVAIDRDDTDLGFYEDRGLELSQVLGEQIALWLPMRSLCDEDCRGICARCGVNRNRTQCSCEEQFVDPRWDKLRSLKAKH
jgi:uncharacterized protein